MKIKFFFRAGHVSLCLGLGLDWGWSWRCQTGLSLPLTVSGQYFFCGSFVLFISCDFHAFASVRCCLVVACWGGGGWGLASCPLFVMFDCVFVTFPCVILGQVW